MTAMAVVVDVAVVSSTDMFAVNQICVVVSSKTVSRGKDK